MSNKILSALIAAENLLANYAPNEGDDHYTEEEKADFENVFEQITEAKNLCADLKTTNPELLEAVQELLENGMYSEISFKTRKKIEIAIKKATE